MSKILLVDGHSIANRAFYGVPLLTNSKGIYTNAVFGFFNILWKVLDIEKPEYLGIAFDLKAPTFRHKLYQDYKGTRSAMPEELLQQIPILKEVLEKAGVSLQYQEGYEADDVLGTMGKWYGEQGHAVTILSGDRDLLQLVDAHIKLLIPKTKKGGTEMESYHEADVLEKYGRESGGVFTNESAHGRPFRQHSRRAGPLAKKTASKIIQAYQTVENAIAHCSEIKPARAAHNLEAYQEQARLSLALATICTDCPHHGQAGKLTEQTFATPEFIEALKEYEFKSLLQRVQKQEAAGEAVQESLAMPEAMEEAEQLDLAALRQKLPEFTSPLVIALCGEEDAYAGLAVNQVLYRRGCRENACRFAAGTWKTRISLPLALTLSSFINCC